MPKVGSVPCKPDMRRRYRTICLVAAIVFVLDQLTKLWIQQAIPVWEKGFTVIPGFFDIVHILNRGAAFGFLNRHDIDWQRPFFIVVSILAVGLIWVLARSQEDDGPFYVYGLGLILGGALGNLLDRARLGVVVDFLDFYVGDMHWPAFNVADMGICIGAAALLVSFTSRGVAVFPTIIEIAPFVLFGFTIGPFALHTYGLFVAAGFLLGIAWSMREARARGLDPDIVSDLGFYIILGAIIGARVLYVLINPVYFWNNPLEILMFWKGGLVFSGGAILATLFALGFMRVKKEDPWLWMDVLAPGIGLGEAVGRIGCLAAGCCYGAVCDLPWAITFFDPESLAPLHVPLHPTQLYHSLAGLICFAVTLALKPWTRNTGQLMGIFLALFGSFRFVIELFRADYRGDFGPISVTQVIALGAVGLGLFIIQHRRRNV